MRILLLASVVILAGCQRPVRSASSAIGTAAPALSDMETVHRSESLEEEQRIRALTSFAVGIVQELNHDSERALRTYYESAMADPANGALVVEITRRLLQNKEYAQALTLLERAVAVPEASGEVYAWYGFALAQADQPEKALKACRTARRISPGLALPYQTMAQIFFQAAKPKEVIRTFEQGCEQSEGTAEFFMELSETGAALSAQMGDRGAQLRPVLTAALDRAVGLKPGSPLVLQKIGDIYRQLGAFDKAAGIYRDLADRFAGMPAFRDLLREKLIDVYVKSGNRQAARELLESVLKEAPTNAQVYLALGSLAVAAKEYPTAADHFEKALDLNPALEAVHYELAGLQITLNKPQAALELLETARKKFQTNFVMELYTALAYNRLKQYDEALKYLTAAEGLAKANDPKRLNEIFYFQLGATHERRGDLEQAERCFHKCLELDPENAEAMNYLGYMWADKGIKLEEARGWIERALKLEPNNPAYLDSLGWVLFRQNKPRAALKYLQKAIQLLEEPDATIQDHLGDVYQALGQLDKARECWRESLKIEPNPDVEKKLK
ncbi:MAG TPA: tetratricopeptide repeat protein [Candidatus Paceibacterota bacterium]|nr:tetratricopeptide repeat protein [Verrucomicrobiota bacterium]HRY47755.1 tetratricopeptide repeat protein [Candidatus Paceibacterota bacterium]HSA02996.1 tetratricopeptide repeat protein [Candidatus Paceibacterota bacterium]